jgi:phosphatidylserine decarboxylase
MGILYLLPKNIISRIMGFILHLPFGSWAIYLFARFYRIDLSEAEKDYTEYRSIGDFFIRKLKAQARPIANSPLVHPSDSLISQIGKIDQGTLIQAKNHRYKISDFLKRKTAENEFADGLFITYYLCPTDYHRVHSPFDGDITSVHYVPGQLWPVNHWSTENIENLFCINERVIVNFNTEWGPVSLVLVGATNVGKISLSFEKNIVSNQGQHKPQFISYDQPIKIQKGAELGIFHMGSTVIMCYPRAAADLVSDGRRLALFQSKVKIGESLI